LETQIILNLNISEYGARNRYDGPEWAIVVAASIASFLSENRQAVGLTFNGIDPLDLTGDEMQRQFEEESGRLQLPPGFDDPIDGENDVSTQSLNSISSIPPKTGRTHLMKLLERLARIEPRHDIPLFRWIARSCNQLSWGTNIIAITPSGDEKICAALHQLVRTGYSPSLIVVDAQTDMRTARERARNLGFRAFEARNDRELNQWRRPNAIA
jgi:uncharacterized protein (DUF58 family)